jgi:hypothetical protein
LRFFRSLFIPQGRQRRVDDREETKFDDLGFWRPTHRAKGRSMNGAQFYLPWSALPVGDSCKAFITFGFNPTKIGYSGVE